jgi:hypothetical protein
MDVDNTELRLVVRHLNKMLLDLANEVETLKDAVKELQAEVKALKGEPINLDTKTTETTVRFNFTLFNFGKSHKLPKDRLKKKETV